MCRRLQNRNPFALFRSNLFYRHLGQVDKTPNSVMASICDRSLSVRVRDA
jgi:hypothetical protein